MPLYKVLSYCGVIPFIMAALGTLVFDSDGNFGKSVLALQLIYAGLICSFLSGIHWSHSFPRSSEGQMLFSMIPPIVSLFLISVGLLVLFGGLLTLLPSKIILSTFFMAYIGLFAFIYIFDWQQLDLERFPDGYIAFRVKITAIVMASLMATSISLWI